MEILIRTYGIVDTYVWYCRYVRIIISGVLFVCANGL